MRICQATATSDFLSILDTQDEAIQTSFICRVNNEAVLKAFFNMNAKEPTFSKAVAMATEIEDAAKAAKMTMYGTKPTDTATPIYKVNPAKTVPKQRESGETVSEKSTSGFKKGTCPRCGRKGHLAKDCPVH